MQVVPHISCPIVMFSYYNLILARKSEWFLSALEDAGVKGNAWLVQMLKLQNIPDIRNLIVLHLEDKISSYFYEEDKDLLLAKCSY